LKATAHHANSSEDESAETDDCARIDREGLHCLHEGLSATETDGSLGAGNAGEGESDQSRTHHARGTKECLF
jgi:hypothetical protein